MAKICRARFLGEQADKVVAIKMVQPQYSKDQAFKTMFMDEIKVTFGLLHPNVIQTYDYGIHKGQLFVAMEYCDGRNLKEYLEKLRYWLGFRSARFISLPLKLVYFFARLGDWINRIPINSTSFLMLINSQTDNPQAFSNAVGFKPKSFGEVLLENSSQTQDRWHARLYFLKPILRFAIASVWI